MLIHTKWHFDLGWRELQLGKNRSDCLIDYIHKGDVL